MKKTVLITGTSSGIGQAAALEFANQGWNVAATMRTPEKDTTLKGKAGIQLYALDVTKPESIDAAMAAVVKDFGRIDVVVNNAGYGVDGAFEGFSDEVIHKQFDTNVFGLMRFNPGPGWGGHCIPLDPFYLSWKAKEHGATARFIELAGELNVLMPEYVVGKLTLGLNDQRKAVRGARVLMLGIAYKKDIDDPRESPAFEILERLLHLGAEVAYHDPHIPNAPRMRSWPDLPAMSSVPLDAASVASYDAVLLLTDHTRVDYALVREHAKLVVDTRGVYREAFPALVKA